MFSSLPRPQNPSPPLSRAPPRWAFLASPLAPFGSVQDFQSPPIYPLHCKQWGPLDFLMVLRIELEFQRSWTPPRCVTRLLLTTTPPPPSSPCCSGSPDIAAHHTPTPLVALIDMFVPWRNSSLEFILVSGFRCEILTPSFAFLLCGLKKIPVWVILKCSKIWNSILPWCLSWMCFHNGFSAAFFWQSAMLYIYTSDIY